MTLILLCYPMLLLAVKGSMNSLFFLLLITSAFCLYRASRLQMSKLRDGYSIAFALAMSSPVLAVFLSQAYHGTFTAPAYDAPSRFLLAVPIFLALRQVNIKTLAFLQYGLPLGAISGLITGLIVHDRQSFYPRISNMFLHPIHFGDLALALGFLSLFSIHMVGRDNKFVVVLKLLGWLAGLYASVASGSRGGWLAIPVMLLAWLIIQNKERHLVRLPVAFALIFLAAVGGYFFVGVIHERVDFIYTDLMAAWHGNDDTSLGIRLQLWKVALLLFQENPVFGVGSGGFAPMMTTLSQSGLITQLAAHDGAGEVHNYILASMARLGIFGLLSALAIYLVPLALFLKTAKSNRPVTKKASMMGICLVLGFLVFGLSVETFNLKMVAAFYGLTLAVLLAIATNNTRSGDYHV